jgi:hypothetical protein
MCAAHGDEVNGDYVMRGEALEPRREVIMVVIVLVVVVVYSSESPEGLNIGNHVRSAWG